MERDNSNTSAGTNGVEEHTVERSLQVFEFIIDGNSERLHDAGCRVLTTPGLTRNAGCANGFQLFGGVDGFLVSLPTNRIGDFASVFFLAVRSEDFSKFCRWHRPQQLACWLAGCRVESKIQHAARLESESS